MLTLVATLLGVNVAGITDPASGGDSPKYDRGDWGGGRWARTKERGENGCRWDVRHLYLVAHSLDPATIRTRKVKWKPCLVTRLTYWDHYQCHAVTAPGRRAHLDEIVSLREAHDSGGAAWSKDKKKAFHNDSSNWVITSASINGRKSDTDPGGERARGRGEGWWPPTPEQACWYAWRWIFVKEKWGLLYDLDEARALWDQLDLCWASGPIEAPLGCSP